MTYMSCVFYLFICIKIEPFCLSPVVVFFDLKSFIFFYAAYLTFEKTMSSKTLCCKLKGIIVEIFQCF